MGELITVFLADDNLIAREGVRALIELENDLQVVGAAADYDGLIAGAEEFVPRAVVTNIRMPPAFQREGIDAALQIRKSHPGTGVVILSQFDDPAYAVSLFGEGAAGFAYLLKDRVAEGDQLARAIREVTGGGSVIDPRIVELLINPVRDDSLTPRKTTCSDRSRRAGISRRSRSRSERRPRRCRAPSSSSFASSPRAPGRGTSGRCSASERCIRRSSSGRNRGSV
ncbi:MAG: response regulator transcription factor [Gaiellaceae bacterium]